MTTRASCRSIPHLPDGISRLTIPAALAEFRLTVDVNHAEVTYTLRDGPGGELTIRHAGEELELNTESPTTVAVRQRKPLLPPPPQPPGREPMHHPWCSQPETTVGKLGGSARFENSRHLFADSAP